MKTLLTGATGFIGSALARTLLERGHEVRVLVREASNTRNIDGLTVEIARGDLRDSGALDRALKGCSVLFHCAADYRLWAPNPREMYEINVTGTRNIMLAAARAGVERIVYTSSVATLGVNDEGRPADEDTPAGHQEMVGHYKRSKFMAEADVNLFVRQRGLPVVIVNPSTPVGPRDIKPTPIGKMIVEAASGRMPAYVDTGLNIVHVDDVALGHALALEKGKIGERYILGGFNMTLKDILVEIARLTGRKPPAISLPHGLVMPLAFAAEVCAVIFRKEPRFTRVGVRLARKKMFFSTEKAKLHLGLNPRPAHEAFSDAVDWFRNFGYIS